MFNVITYWLNEYCLMLCFCEKKTENMMSASHINDIYTKIGSLVKHPHIDQYIIMAI